MFRERFQYYKSKEPPPDLQDVFDIDKYDHKRQFVRERQLDLQFENTVTEKFGMLPTKEWKTYDFINLEGLILIKNPFTPLGQRQWIKKCLRDFTRKPSVLNIDGHNFLNSNDNWWDVCYGETQNKNLISKLRWATLGYHHNWDTKEYAEKTKSDIPNDLKELSEILASAIGFGDFKPQAVIINYYRMNSTLSGHTDHSEIFLEAPLLSVSFGQSAIFLIGGYNIQEEPKAIFLKSGDVIVMSGDSRLRYHGVPRIVKTDYEYWNFDEIKNVYSSSNEKSEYQETVDYVSEARINLNIRQVLAPEQITL